MPTYEYVCTECGEPLEVVQSIHDPALTECPRCRGRLRKQFGNVGVVFKGSGFYRTDSRGKSGATAPDSPKKPAAASTSGSGGSGSGSGSSASGTGSGSAGGSGSGAGSAGASAASA